MGADLLAHFPPGAVPRPAQRRLLEALGRAIDAVERDADPPRVFLVEAPPGVGKSHVAITIARWSGCAYLLTSQKLLQEQYEREFGGEVQLVMGRDNYVCERYPEKRVPTSHGMCRRRGGPPCRCAYARAKAAALEGPLFCTNIPYFLTLRQWQREAVERRRVLVVDEAHNLESQLVGFLTVRFAADQMAAWFGAPLPRHDAAELYRELMVAHLDRLETELAAVERDLEGLTGPAEELADFLRFPPSPAEQALLSKRDALTDALARIRLFVGAEDQEWVVRYPAVSGAMLELMPLKAGALARDLLFGAADLVVLSSAFLGPRAVLAEALGLDASGVRVLASDSPFPLEQRPIVYRPVGALSRATLAELEPAVFDEVATILRENAGAKGLIHVPSYAVGERLIRHLHRRAPFEHGRVIWIDSAAGKSEALEHHRTSRRSTVLLSPSLREGIDLPDDFLRFQILTKVPYPDLGDPWTATRAARDPRWYALETAKALVQTYGRSCRHAEDHGVTYVLDAQFSRFLTRYRMLLPPWFRDAAHAAVRAGKTGTA